MKIHHFSLSGHAHRAVLFASLLGLEAELVHVDLAGGAHKQPAFLALNPFGQVPVLEDGEVVIADSNAILVTGQEGRPHRLAARGCPGAAAVQRWLSVAAGELAMARPPPPHYRLRCPFCRKK
jgi:glutathione S-transferase